jgi:zinc and cadmium transporter
MTYALIVAVLSLIGAAVPLRVRFGHAQLQVYLSLAAGALLGAALFHLLPEASEHIHGAFGPPAVIGIGVVFLLQRYLAPHSHEPLGHSHRESEPQAEPTGANPRAPACGSEPHAHVPVRPLVTGVVAILALSIHSFFDGVAIGAAAGGPSGPGAPLAFAVFLSVLIHKPMDGLAVSVLLLNAGTRSRNLWSIQAFYAALVPVGTAVFLLTRGSVAEPSTFVGYTLAFSAGTFLAIALTDLLPELHFHAHDRHKLSAALLTGLLVMWLTSLIGHPRANEQGHQHGGTSGPSSTKVVLEQLVVTEVDQAVAIQVRTMRGAESTLTVAADAVGEINAHVIPHEIS